MKRTTQLKQLVARRNGMIVPGAANAMFAKVIEDLGFEVVYLTGAGIANMHLGAPDIGLTTMSEVANTLAATADAVDLPIIVDGDTGFGNAINVVRTIKTFERAGAAGVQLEDQVFPKKCGHFAGKDVIPLDDMIQKLKAALDARQDQDLQIIARTDARAIEGLDRAIDRAQAFIECGADITFVEAPVSLDELKTITTRLKVPQIANVVYGGKTPDAGHEKFAEMGFSIVLYANAALQAAIKSSYDVLSGLKQKGSLDALGDKLASFEERQRVVSKDEWDALEARYRA